MSPHPDTDRHIPVLLEQTLQLWLPDVLRQESQQQENQQIDVFVDATLGGGGHTQALIERYIQQYGQERFETHFVLVGIDQDLAILRRTETRLLENFPFLAGRAHFCHGNFADLPTFLQQLGIPQITGGFLADIGVSSFQLDQAERGFSFNKDAVLDMRMDNTQSFTAADIVNGYSEKDLVTLFSEYGEERFSKTIARLICERRKQQLFQTTRDLAQPIEALYRQKLGGKPQRIHPATKVFQALRIETNHELERLQALLTALPNSMASGARALIISFHSLEDRIVKHAFREMSSQEGAMALLTKKPVIATEAEIRQNPRSRSAKLRCIQKI